jgi:hypothetical protein
MFWGNKLYFSSFQVCCLIKNQQFHSSKGVDFMNDFNRMGLAINKGGLV